jgi:hypothetical protein
MGDNPHMAERLRHSSSDSPGAQPAAAAHGWGQEPPEQRRQLHERVLVQRSEFRSQLAHHVLHTYEHGVRHGGPRDTKLAALELLGALHDLQAIVQEHIRAAVDECRIRHATWAQIGDVLGVTRQSAHERYTPATRPASSSDR